MANSLLTPIFFAVTLTLAVCDGPDKKTGTKPTPPPAPKNSIPGTVLQTVRTYHETLTLKIKGPTGAGQTQNSDSNGNDVNANATMYGSIPGAVLQSETSGNGSLPVPLGSIPGAVLTSLLTKGDNSPGAFGGQTKGHERRRRSGIHGKGTLIKRETSNLDQPRGP